MSTAKKPLVLVIMDGWGYSTKQEHNAVAAAKTPNLDRLARDYTSTLISGSGLDVEDTLYTSPAGPISVLDVIYGLGRQIESSGVDFYAHKTGFSNRSLIRVLRQAGFPHTFSALGNLEINTVAFVEPPDTGVRARFGLPG